MEKRKQETIRKVRVAARRVARSRDAEESARARLAEAVVAAVDVGVTEREIAEAAGCHRSRVGQIYRETKGAAR